MRLLSSWNQFLATSDAAGVQIHQYADATIQADIPAGRVRLQVRTGYPWQGQVTVHIVQSPEEPWALTLRLPQWSRSPDASPKVVHERRWQAGETVVLDLDMSVRITEPDRRVDAVRGCVAFERGPLVYCVESADIPTGTELEDLAVDPDRAPLEVPRPDIAESVVGLQIPVTDSSRNNRPEDSLVAGAIPYYTWANRKVDAMRVWIPCNSGA
jgi:DUF1680 family protein